MRRIGLFLIFAFVMQLTFSSPVFRIHKTVKQSDGTTLSVTRVGADNLMYFVTDDGYPIIANEKGDFCYAKFDNDFNVIATDQIAHEISIRTIFETSFANKCKEDFDTQVKMHRLSRYGVGSISSASVSCKGDVKVAVILAEFSDLSFKEENDIERFSKHFNASNYKEEGGAGSVRDYFIAQSDSLFRPSFDIVAKVKVKNPMKYYGANSGGDDVRGRAYISDAVDAAIAQGVDFKPYLNKKGELFVIVIYPGHGEQVAGASETLWAQYYYSMSHTVGNIKLASGLVMDELANYGTGEMFDGIGTLCHEFSHALGLPDFYNTNGARNIFGMDAWSIMDYGQYNNISRTPVGYTSYEREFMGWLKIDTLKDEKQYVSLAPLHTKASNRAYRIPNKADKTGNEYYLIENRQSSPWYISIYGEGMLVLHVDYDQSAWSSNSVNNSLTHQRMTIIPADNTLSRISAKATDYKGDMFPGYMTVREFSNTTTPAATAYTGNYMNIKMKNISEIADNIEFYYQCEGRLATPKNITSNNVSPDGFELSFNSVANVEEYIVDLYVQDSLVQTDTLSATSVIYTDLTEEMTYNLSIKAIAANYLDSDFATFNITLPKSRIAGDVNCDGSVNSTDIVCVYNYIALGEKSGVNPEYADVNGNGEINSSDIVTIYNIIIGGK